MGQIELIGGGDAPRQRGQPVKIVACGAVFRRAGLQHRQLVELIIDARLNPLRHLELVETAAEGIDVVLAIILGDAQLTLDDLELFAQEEFALMLLHLRVDLLGDLGLQLCDLDFLAQQGQHLLHALHHRQRLQHLLQLSALGRGDGGGEISQRTRFMRAEAVEVLLELLTVQRVDRQQLLYAVDHRHRVGARLIALGIDRLARIGDLDQIGRLARQPARDAEAAQSLGDELYLVIAVFRLVDAHGRADLGEVLDPQLIDLDIADEGQTDSMMRRIADQLHGLGPTLLVDHQRLDLGREERAIVNRQQVDALRQLVATRHQPTRGGRRRLL